MASFDLFIVGGEVALRKFVGLVQVVDGWEEVVDGFSSVLVRIRVCS